MPRALTAQPLVMVAEAASEGAAGPVTARNRAMPSDMIRARDKGLLCDVRMVSLRGRVQDGPHSEIRSDDDERPMTCVGLKNLARTCYGNANRVVPVDFSQRLQMQATRPRPR